MSGGESFARLSERVCREQGWDLLPGGVRIELPGGRRQVVSFESFEYEDEERLRLTTRIGEFRALSAPRLEVALRANAVLAHGALAIDDDGIVMTATHSLEGIEASELEAALRYLAATADEYEALLFGTDRY